MIAGREQNGRAGMNHDTLTSKLPHSLFLRSVLVSSWDHIHGPVVAHVWQSEGEPGQNGFALQLSSPNTSGQHSSGDDFSRASGVSTNSDTSSEVPINEALIQFISRQCLDGLEPDSTTTSHPTGKVHSEGD